MALDLFKSPKKFYSKLSLKDNWVSTKTFLQVIIIPVILASIYAIIIPQEQIQGIHWSITFPTAFIAGLLIWLVGLLILTFLTHIGVIVMNGKKGISETYNIMAYSITVLAVYSAINYAVLILLALLLNPQQLLDVSPIVSIPLLLISFVHWVYANTQGIKEIHRLSLGAALTSSLFSIILVIIATLFLVGLILSVALFI